MNKITVLVTGAGAPGTKGTLYSLKNNFDSREVYTIGTDIQSDVVGRYLCNRFYQVPPPSSSEFLARMLSICKEHNVDVILPQTTDELPVFASYVDEFEKIGTKVAVSNRESIDIANNKYNLMQIAEDVNVPVPRYSIVSTAEELKTSASKLGWPEVPVVVKPPVSSGTRGLRIIDESINLKERFFLEKPTGVYTTMDEILHILGESFPSLVIMEYLPGKEYTVDVLNANQLTVIPRSRDMIRSGITFNGTIENNKEMIEYSKKLTNAVGLKFAHGYQFKLDKNGVPKLLECNPRVQGTMVLSTLAGANVIYGAVKYALGEDVPPFEIKWGTRLLRYWGGVGIVDGRIVEVI